jgi:hypothetical protein
MLSCLNKLDLRGLFLLTEWQPELDWYSVFKKSAQVQLVKPWEHFKVARGYGTICGPLGYYYLHTSRDWVVSRLHYFYITSPLTPLNSWGLCVKTWQRLMWRLHLFACCDDAWGVHAAQGSRQPGCMAHSAERTYCMALVCGWAKSLFCDQWSHAHSICPHKK